MSKVIDTALHDVRIGRFEHRHGLPVVRFSYRKCDNDDGLIEAATSVMGDLPRAAGAEDVITSERFADLVGGARMATRPEDGVVDAEHRVFGTDGLYVVDSRTLPTQGSANPALTIMAPAARAADLMNRNPAATTSR